jgi:hypothetical protein
VKFRPPTLPATLVTRPALHRRLTAGALSAPEALLRLSLGDPDPRQEPIRQRVLAGWRARRTCA